jgi:hypothetical protein
MAFYHLPSPVVTTLSFYLNMGQNELPRHRIKIVSIQVWIADDIFFYLNKKHSTSVMLQVSFFQSMIKQLLFLNEGEDRAVFQNNVGLYNISRQCVMSDKHCLITISNNLYKYLKVYFFSLVAHRVLSC